MRKRNVWGIAFCIIFLLAVFFRLPPLVHSAIPFTYDTGLTFLEVRNMVLGHGLRLIGPEGGIKGIFFGPTWYYLLGIIFFFSGGDPRSLAFLSFILNITTIFVAWKIGNKVDKKTGFFAASFFAFSSGIISSSNSGFVVDTFVLINLIAVYFLIPPLTQKKLFFLGFWGSLSFHFEPVVAIGFNLALFVLLFSPIRKLSLRDKLFLSFVWLLPFVPQLLFEIRHNFLQTHAIIAELARFGQGLGGNLPIGMRLINRPLLLINNFISTTSNGNMFLSFLLLFYLVIGLSHIKDKKNTTKKTLAMSCFIFLVIPLFYYIFLFPPGIKNWYYASFPALYGILITLGLSSLFVNQLIKFIVLFTLFLFILINTQPQTYLQLFNENFPSNDPSSLKNELSIVKWIYADANGKPFVVYTYSPAVYDYPYQYLFWWYARKQNLPYPKDVSYRPNTYDYVPQKLSFTQPPETGDTFTTYLIFLPYHPEYHRYWLPEHFLIPFAATQLMSKNSFPGELIVEKRIKQ